MITALERELIALHDAPREVAPFSERFPGLTPEDGYRAARHLHAHRVAQGWRPAGRKIGFTNRTLWARYGVFEPMWGMVYDRTLQFAIGNRAKVPLAGLVQPRIEPEICFKLKSDVKGAPRPSELLDAIEWAAHCVEIVQCHHPKWKVTIADCCADNGLHGRLIVGEAADAREIPGLAERLPAIEARLFKGDTLVDRGTGANVLGSPLASLAHLAAVLARDAGAPPLAAGEIVTTGVLTDAHPVAPGERWRTEIDGIALPGLEIRFR